MRVIQNINDPCIRFVDLKPGDVFNACGDAAIKTVDGKAVVLKDGNYVSRLPNDLIVPMKAEVIIG